MTPPRKKAAKKTTPRARAKEAVAEEVRVEPTDEAVAPSPPPMDEPVALVPPPVVPAAHQPVDLVGIGPCRVCGGPGAIQAKFPWTADAPVFCRRDTPPQYRFLLHD